MQRPPQVSEAFIDEMLVVVKVSRRSTECNIAVLSDPFLEIICC